MKISKNILESIIRQVIREQYTISDYEGDPMRQFAEGYLLVAQATSSPYWGKSVSVLLTQLVLGIMKRLNTHHGFSAKRYHTLSKQVINSPKVLGQISQVTNAALSQAPAFQSAQEDSKQMAKTSIEKIIKAACGSVVVDELIAVVFYQMRSVLPQRIKQVVDDEGSYSELKNSDITIELTPEEISNALSGMDVLKIARHVWEQVMKFVGFTHVFENPQFDDFRDFRLFGFTEDQIGDYEDATPLTFGWNIEAPF
tara:strand:+ start:162 stop:926 length:765 start_codon:yes stop_codon:yes gene_type:complete